MRWVFEAKNASVFQCSITWIEAALHGDLAVRDARWSDAVGVGSLAFVEKIKGELGVKALHREIEQLDGSYALREPGEAYSGHFHIENEALNVENTLPWERIGEVPAT